MEPDLLPAAWTQGLSLWTKVPSGMMSETRPASPNGTSVLTALTQPAPPNTPSRSPGSELQPEDGSLCLSPVECLEAKCLWETLPFATCQVTDPVETHLARDEAYASQPGGPDTQAVPGGSWVHAQWPVCQTGEKRGNGGNKIKKSPAQSEHPSHPSQPSRHRQPPATPPPQNGQRVPGKTLGLSRMDDAAASQEAVILSAPSRAAKCSRCRMAWGTAGGSLPYEALTGAGSALGGCDGFGW